MRFRRWFLAVLPVLAVGYIAYPYVTLYRLAHAVADGDSRALSGLVAWETVRDGVKEDICDAVMDLPEAGGPRETKLRPFGYSFVRGVAANVIDANITPEAIASVANSSNSAVFHSQDGMKLTWAFFESPRRFGVAFGTRMAAGPESELRIRMELRRGTWVVTRVWLPVPMLMVANSRT